MKRPILTVLLLALCACTCGRYKPRPISPEAAMLFARADSPDAGASFVLDLEVMRSVGLLSAQGAAGDAAAGALLSVLPGLAAELADDPIGPALARASVAAALLREAGEWPRILRLGVFVPAPGPEMLFDSLREDALLVLAVDGSRKANVALLKALASLHRAGGGPGLTRREEAFCLADEGLDLCVHAGNGLFAVTSAGAQKLLPTTGVPLPIASGALLRVRAAMPGMARGELSVTGESGLRVALAVETERPEQAAVLEAALRGFVARLDGHQNKIRSVLSPALDSARRALEQDAEAPAGLKQIVAAMTVDRMLDPSGAWAAMRGSLKLGRDGTTFAAELTLPEAQVQRLGADGGLVTTLAASGALAEIAATGLQRYRCRVRQDEAHHVLTTIHALQQKHYDEHLMFGQTLDAIGYVSDAFATDYTTCLNGRCLPCTRPGCRPLAAEHNPCADPDASSDEAGEPFRYVACVAADLDGDPQSVDVWTLDADSGIVLELDECG